MERLSAGELRTILRAVQRALECSVCLEPIRDSATICQNGHGVCKTCSRLLEECPQCRRTFSSIVPTMLNSVIQLMPRPCKFEENGCETMIVQSTSSNHETLCGYRDANCWLPRCMWTGLVNDILNHIQCDHHSITVYTVENKRCQWPKLEFRKGFRVYNPVYAFDSIIWARGEVSSTLDFLMTFHVVPRRVECKLMAIVSFKRGDFEITNTVPVVHKEADENVKENEIITISNSKIKLFTTNTGVVVYSLKIVKDLC